ncbi:MAG: nlhH, partial [Rhizobium sp.]|nr:nlhH [Rhizobium sp.]
MTSSRILAALGLASVLVGTSLGDTARSTPKPAKPDADMAAVLDALGKLGGKPIETLTPDEARKEPTPVDAVKAVLRARHRSASDPVDEVEDRTYKGASGAEIPLRIYTPIGNGPLPVILYFHGGGWVIGNLDLDDATPRALANRTGAIVVSASYRQAPEHKFPAAHDDAFEAYRWVLANTTLIHGDLTRIAIAGEGAGGNLALGTVIRAREEKLPLPAYMVLVYPIAGADMTTPSYVANATARPLDKPMMAWFFEQ